LRYVFRGDIMKYAVNKEKDSDRNGARIDSKTLFIIKMYSVIYRLQLTDGMKE